MTPTNTPASTRTHRPSGAASVHTGQSLPDAELESDVAAIAGRLADGPPLAYRFIKANLNAAETRTAEDMVALEALHQVRVLRTDDAKEAIAAFLDKRTPKFSGR